MSLHSSRSQFWISTSGTLIVSIATPWAFYLVIFLHLGCPPGICKSQNQTHRIAYYSATVIHKRDIRKPCPQKTLNLPQDVSISHRTLSSTLQLNPALEIPDSVRHKLEIGKCSNRHLFMTVPHELTVMFLGIRGRQQECPVPAIPHQADTGLPRPPPAECQGRRPILVDRFGKSPSFSSFTGCLLSPMITLQLSHQLIAPHVTSKLDQHALSFLEDIELKQDVNDFRPYELVFVRPSISTVSISCCAWENS